MRNLKRALSLALAAVMVLGMMVIGAGAASTYEDFTDKDEIQNKEAVNTMVSLGVLAGKNDGSTFDPTGIVTRAEMAKIVAVSLNGGKDPVMGADAKTVFTDVPANHWAVAYIAYCVQQNIIAGRGNGTFGPEEPVTGSAAAKMFLCALGYRADLEGLTGNNWEINTNVLANQDADLYDGLAGINASQGLSRDNTAQMLYNAVQAQEVKYDNLFGEHSDVIQARPQGTMLANRFNVRKVEGVVAATDLFSLEGGTTVKGKTRLTDIEYNGEAYVDKNDNPIDVTYPIAIDNDLMGRRVVIYVKGLNDLAPNAAGMQVVGTYIISDKNTVVETNGRLEKDSDVKDALKGSGLTMPKSGTANAITITEDDTVKGKVDGCQPMPGVAQTFIDNNADGTVDYIIQLNPALAKVNTYSESGEKMNLSSIGSVDFVDILNPKDVAQGDYVLVYNYDDTYVLEKAETASGVVSAFVNNAKNPELSKITVDGTNYGMGSGKMLAPDLLKMAASDMKDLVDGTYTLYLDPHGNILGYVEDEAAVGNYALITAVNPSGNSGFRSVEVKLLLSDGTTGKYDVDLLASAKKWNSATANASGTGGKEEAMYNALPSTLSGVLVTYSLDGNTVTLARPNFSTNNYKETTTTSDLALQNSKSSYTFGANKLMADNKTVFFIKDKEGNYTTVNGLNNLRSSALKTLGTSSAIYYTPTGSATMMARAIYAQVDAVYTSNSNYAFVTGNYTKTTEGNNTIYSYPVVLQDGTTGTLKSKTQDNISKNMVHEYQVSGDYVTFDNTTVNVVNQKVVTGTGVSAVSVANANNSAQGKDSYPTPNTKTWNVENSDNVFDTSMQKNDLVALVLDDDGNVKTAYVYDRQDDDMTNDVATTLAVNGGTLDAGKNEWTGVAANNTLTLNFSTGANQTAKIAVSTTGTGKVSNNGTTVAANQTFNGAIYTAGANENGGKVDVTITVSEDKKADRVINFTVTVSAAKSAAPTAVAVQGNSAAITANADGTFTWADAGAGETLSLNLTVAAGSTAKIKSITKDPALTGTLATVDTSVAGSDVTIYTTHATDDAGKSGDVTVVVTVDDGANLPVDLTYVFHVTVPVLYKVNGAGGVTAGTKDVPVIIAGSAVGEFFIVKDAEGNVIQDVTEAIANVDGGSSGNNGIKIKEMPAKNVTTVEVFKVTPANVGLTSGLIATVSTDKTYYAKDEVVTVTVKVQGTAPVGGAVVTAKSAGTSVTITNISSTFGAVTDVNEVTILPNTQVDGTITFTYTMVDNGTNADAPTVSIA